MSFQKLIPTIHEKGNQEDLFKLLDWWYNVSDNATKKTVMDKLEAAAYRMTPAEAEIIVRNMKTRGQHWTHNQIKEYLKGKGVDADCVYYYLVMNMAYNDYYATAKMFGLQNDVEFFYSLARDFIEDMDAKPLKIEKYFCE